MFQTFFAFLGTPVILFGKFIEKFGDFLLFHFHLFPHYFTKPFRSRLLFQQIDTVGTRSLGVIILTAIFLGLVQAIQMYNGFHRFGAENMMGYTIFYSIGREIGPVFAALMITSRAISAMAAELGTMRVSEQIDAIDTLAIDSKKYLLVPRILATAISLPMLTALFDTIANISAYLISGWALDVNTSAYLSMITQYTDYADYLTGILKATIFGLFIGMVGTYIGYNTKGGARGVGESTTQSVVISSVVILILDYFLDALFLLINL